MPIKSKDRIVTLRLSDELCKKLAKEGREKGVYYLGTYIRTILVAHCGEKKNGE